MRKIRLLKSIPFFLVLVYLAGCNSGGGGGGAPPDQPPALSPVPDQESKEGQAVSLVISASDPEGGTLTFAAQGLPPGLAIDARTGTIRGTVEPGAAAGSPYHVVITVSDGSQTAELKFSWVITPANEPPRISELPNRLNHEGDSVSLVLSAQDPEGDPLTFSVEGLPPGLTFDPGSSTIEGTISPGAAALSPYEIKVTVSDGTNQVSASFIWRVLPAEVPPVTGRLIVGPQNILEKEPNDELAQAQQISPGERLSGFAERRDPGYLLDPERGVEIEDLFRLQADQNVRITLTIAEDDLIRTDLDLILLDSQGRLLDASQGYVDMEVLDTEGPGSFIVGVRAYRGGSAYVLALDAASIATSSSLGVPVGADFVPGELIVKRKNTGRFKAAEPLGFSPEETLSGGAVLLRAHAGPGFKAEGKLSVSNDRINTLRSLTFAALRSLQGDPSIVYTEPNYIYKPCRVPNDPHFRLQWHYNFINLPDAWDLSVGSDQTVVAVVDTGILSGHPDLAGKITEGYDFISDPQIANDGDGRDPDPEDAGDDPRGFSPSFHGTHVAGTIGAATDNNTGVAGVAWKCLIMPVRVLGVGGGTSADIAEGIRYAAGLPNASGTTPEKPARVINLSFGLDVYSKTMEEAVREARQAGAILVAAAGNNNTNSPFYPAAYDGVVAVTAVGPQGLKASYSNWGSWVDVAAPGGDLSLDLTGDSFPDGVLSTSARGFDRFNYEFEQGTSMATPHVSGIAALMLSVNPQLTAQDFDLLLSGRHPQTNERITREAGTAGFDPLYGWGIIDAARAVHAASTILGAVVTGPASSRLSVSAVSLDFKNYLETLVLHVTNGGTGVLTITSIEADQPWISVEPTGGVTPLALHVSVDRNGLPEGTYTGTVRIESDARQGSPTANVTVTMHVGGPTMGDVGTVYVLLVDYETFQPVATTDTDREHGYNFTLKGLEAGTYLLIASTDRDNDGLVGEPEDAVGAYPDPITLVPGGELEELSIVIGELIAPQTAGRPLPLLLEKGL